MRKILIALTVIICALSKLNAQQNNGSINGSLTDSSNKQPLSFATIAVYKTGDSSLVTYRMSDESGNYKITGLPLSTSLRVVVTFSGYKVFRKEFRLTSDKASEAFGKIMLAPDATPLDEVVIYSERPPVIVKNDTIEFNASSFKTLPTALVEDLLKKLPGVDVDRSGNIVVNGKPVSRILVDGKDFFGGDPKVATRNLPANIIDKVQVMDDKKQLDMNPLMRKEEADQVINLKLKKSIKKGWFGKAYAGAGTDGRNEAGAIINSFRDTLQISTLGYKNNLNRSGFSSTELFDLGGFQRAGVNSISMTNTGGIAFNDISFGGMGEGIQRSLGGGININYSARKNLNANLMYFTGANQSANIIKENTEQNLNDTILTVKEKRNSHSATTSHRLASKIEWTIDSLTNLWFNPSLQFSNAESETEQLSQSISSAKGALYNNDSKLKKNGDFKKYQHEFSLSRSYHRKLPSLRLMHTMNISDGKNDNYTNAVTDFYTGSFSRIDQLQKRGVYKLFSQTSININKQFARKISVNLNHSITHIKNNDNLNLYELNTASGKYEVYNPLLSNKVNQTGTRGRTGLALNKRTQKNGLLYAGVSIQQLKLINRFENFETVEQRYTYLLPNAGISLKGFNFSYSASVTEPNAADLQQVIDNSNPVFQVLGNPGLVPSISHNFSVYKNKYNSQKLLSVNLSANLSVQNSAVIRERWVDGRGVQFTRPVNRDGIINFNQRISLRKQYKLSRNRSFSLNLANNLGYTKTYTIVNSVSGRQNNYYTAPSVSISFNWQDKVELSQSCNYTWNYSSYSNPGFAPVTIKTLYYTADVIVRLPKKFVWESNLEYGRNNDIAPGFNQSTLRWNAAINYQFLKDNKGNLKLSAFDLLKQNAGISRFVKENYVRDTEQSVLTRYFLATFTYNIRDFKTKMIGGKDAILWF